MLQPHLAAAAAGGLLLAAVTAIGDDRAPPAPAPLVAVEVAQAAPPATGGPAARRSFRVGDIAPQDRLHRITTPGLYGLSDPPSGDAYAILDGELIRIQKDSGKILSVLWRVERILD